MRKTKKVQPLTDEEIKQIEAMSNKAVKVIKKELFARLKSNVEYTISNCPREDAFEDDFSDYCVDEMRCIIDLILAEKMYNEKKEGE